VLFRSNVLAKTSREKPGQGNYVFVVKKVEDTISKVSNPMIVLHLDIDEGPCKGFFADFPIRYFQPYHTENAKGKLKQVLLDFAKSNSGSFTEAEINKSGFDERRLVGMKIGGFLKPRDDDKGYLMVAYLCPVDEARKANDGSSKNQNLI
jgi:hypothetical protein